MPKRQRKRQVRCANCKSTEFTAHVYAETTTPVVLVGGEKITAERTGETSFETRSTLVNYRCNNCEQPVASDVVGLVDVRADLLAQLQTAQDALREQHFFLFPELYPPEKQAHHGFASEPGQLFEWRSDTIEGVADILLGATKHIPGIPKEAGK